MPFVKGQMQEKPHFLAICTESARRWHFYLFIS